MQIIMLMRLLFKHIYSFSASAFGMENGWSDEYINSECYDTSCGYVKNSDKK